MGINNWRNWRILSEGHLQSELQSSDSVSSSSRQNAHLNLLSSLKIIHEILCFFFQQHLCCVVLNSAPQQNNCQSNSVGDPVSKTDISHERPTSCWVFCNSSCAKCKSFHEVGTGSISIDIRYHLVLKSLICNTSNIEGGLGKHAGFFFSPYKYCWSAVLGGCDRWWVVPHALLQIFQCMCPQSDTKKTLRAHIHFVLPWFVIKEQEGSYRKCAARRWTVWFWSQRRSFIIQNTAIFIMHTVTKSQWVWPAGGHFSQAALSGSRCRECHFQDELWGLRQHNGSNGAHFRSISPAHWHHTEAQQTQPLISTWVSLGLPGVWWRPGAALGDARSSPW